MVFLRSLKSSWFPFFLGTAIVVFMLNDTSRGPLRVKSVRQPYREGTEWIPPDESEIPANEEGELVRYGKELILNTSKYFGPKGIVAQISNGMNCQNCHIHAGTQNFGNPFSAVSSTFPKYRERSGQMESIEFRVNDCIQRSMNGTPIDSLSHEMQAIVAYLKWVGKDVPKDVTPKGAGTEKLSFLNRAADPQKGNMIFANYCQRCHGPNGQGSLLQDSSGYKYPPLWGDYSYNTGAGIYRLSLLAGFIRNNMPYGASWKEPTLTAEQAWDVAAFIVSQQRPLKAFPHDWENDRSKKPIDHPFGPYVDSFPEKQHKYGPFEPIKNRKSTGLEK